MTRAVGLAVAVLAFIVLSTANAGGYRYGISDQAFYVPALAHRMDPALFPRDATLLEPQMRLWLGDDLVAAVAWVVLVELPSLFAVLYVFGLAALVGVAIWLARTLGASWWGVAATLALFTLRHRIAKTGANTLEGYMHPRMLAFAVGLAALVCVLRRRRLSAALLVLAADLVHPTTALWFAVVVGVAVVRDRPRARWAAVAAAAVAVAVVARGPRMDDAWLAVLGEKDYLFPSEWPLYAWLINLASPVVLWLIYRRRRAAGRTSPGEPALVTGLLVLVAGFLVSVPLAAFHVATVVQLQVNRIFWLLDAVVLAYVAWWLMDDVGRRSGWSIRAALALVLAAASVGRGYQVLVIDAGRPLVQWDVGRSEWHDAMRWLRGTLAVTYVLADPGYAWKYGTSVRVAALRDTLLESGKDTAMAMYDRPVAMVVADRLDRLRDFDTMNEQDLRGLRDAYGVDVVVLERRRALGLPVLFENERFTIYDLR